MAQIDRAKIEQAVTAKYGPGYTGSELDKLSRIIMRLHGATVAVEFRARVEGLQFEDKVALENEVRVLKLPR